MNRPSRSLTTWLLGAGLVAIAACHRAEPKASVPQPAAAPGCAALRGANAVRTEMAQLECALQQVVVAIGRDDLASVGPQLQVVHEAREATEHAIETGAWKPTGGPVATFVGMDQSFHQEVEALVQAAAAGDHGGAAAALGRVLAGCQGCHAAYRPNPAP